HMSVTTATDRNIERRPRTAPNIHGASETHSIDILLSREIMLDEVLGLATPNAIPVNLNNLR
ncbi:MAG: hypothetical protein ACREBG_16285, partial [Pyrinomonadaceae bacterium]